MRAQFFLKFGPGPGFGVQKVLERFIILNIKILFGQVENSEIAETTEITEIAVEQRNYKFWQ